MAKPTSTPDAVSPEQLRVRPTRGGLRPGDRLVSALRTPLQREEAEADPTVETVEIARQRVRPTRGGLRPGDRLVSALRTPLQREEAEAESTVETTPRAVSYVLQFTAVSKSFPDGTRALAGVDLTVEGREFVSIVGPSGCGKTTLLRIAAGLTEATQGLVEVRTDKIGCVFQETTLLPWRRVQANVELLTELRHVPKEERRRRADEAIKLAGLGDFTRYYPRLLNGQMLMRVALAQSLALKPELLLLDDPFGRTDQIARQQLNDDLLDLYLSQEFTAVLVTHSVAEAVFMSTRVLVMSSRPGHVVCEYKVPFEYPRLHELQFSEAFTQLASQVSACLRRGS
jgi:NitT/TauT family transport system ATP-binding protein